MTLAHIHDISLTVMQFTTALVGLFLVAAVLLAAFSDVLYDDSIENSSPYRQLSRFGHIFLIVSVTVMAIMAVSMLAWIITSPDLSIRKKIGISSSIGFFFGGLIVYFSIGPDSFWQRIRSESKTFRRFIVSMILLLLAITAMEVALF